MNGLTFSEITLSLTRLEQLSDAQDGPGDGGNILFNSTLMLFMEERFPYPWFED